MGRPSWFERHPRLWRQIARVPRRTGIVLISVLVLVIAARIAAPFVIKEVLNRKLGNLPEYRGSIDDVELSVFTSKFVVDGLRLDKRRGDPKLPFLRVERMVVDYRLDELIHGRIVADVDVTEPVMNVMPEATQKRKPKDQIKKDEEGQAITETVKTLLPTKINHLHIHEGAVRFKDSTANPPVDLKLTQLSLYIADLSNRPASTSELSTLGRISARVQNSGQLRANLRINVFAREPTFDLALELRGLDVRELKDFTRAYAKVDLEKGTAAFFTELRARNGEIHGYFKPILHNVQVLDTSGDDKHDPWYQKAWEGTVEALKDVFENHEHHDQVATRAPISGRFDQPGVGILTTVVEVVVNAFIQALTPSLEHTLGGDAQAKAGKHDDSHDKSDKHNNDKHDAKAKKN
jgi:hypothetical protein